MRKKMYLLSASLVLVLSLCTSGVWGTELQFPDVTLIQKWSGNQAVPGDHWVDVEGPNSFNTYSATYETSTKVLTIFTNWEENRVSDPIGGLSFTTAALFLDFDHNGSWDAGIPLHGGNKGKVFYSPLTFQTSQGVVGNNQDVVYGGLYTTNVAPLTGPPSFVVPVLVSATASLDTASVIWSNPAGSNPDNAVAINLSGVNNGFNPLDFDFLWGTTTCGNDVIIGTIPLPPSLLLFGSGLLGLVGLRRFWKI